MEYPKTPNHDKLKKVKDEHMAVKSFLDFVRYHDTYHLCMEHEIHTQYFDRHGCLVEENILRQMKRAEIERLVAEYFQIDYDAFHEEKEALYQYIAQEARQNYGDQGETVQKS